MANLRDTRLRIRAIQQTLQVTKAMNLISTAKLRTGRRALEDIEPFSTRIEKTMFDILCGTRKLKSKFFAGRKKKEGAQSAILVITGDKGLAGGYNANIIRHVEQLCARKKNPALILMGNIGYRHFSRLSWPILQNYSLKSRLPEYENAGAIADFIIPRYLSRDFDEVHIVYTHMYSSIKLLPRERQLLPLNEAKMQEEFEKSSGKREKVRFEYWPSKSEVFDSLIPMYIKGIIFGSLAEAYVSEQYARMSAMDEASKNAREMLDALQIHYNRVRQAGITQEMTEITSGAEALS